MVTLLIIGLALLLLVGLASGSASTGSPAVTVLVGPPAGTQTGAAEVLLGLLLGGGLLLIFILLTG